MLANCRHLCPLGHYVNVFAYFLLPLPSHLQCHYCPCLCKIKSLNSIAWCRCACVCVRVPKLSRAQLTDFQENFRTQKCDMCFCRLTQGLLLFLICRLAACNLRKRKNVILFSPPSMIFKLFAFVNTQSAYRPLLSDRPRGRVIGHTHTHTIFTFKMAYFGTAGGL